MTKRLLRSHRRALIAQLLLALALLVAQTAAQAHSYSHLATERSDFNGTVGQLCSECLASTPLLSAAGSPTSPCIVFAANAVAVITAAIPACFEPSPLHAFRSRAPPEL